MSDRRSANPVLPVAVTLVVLAGLYVGAYYAMVHATGYGEVWAYYSGWPEGALGIPHERWKQFFAPIHALDRRIRRHVWMHE